MCVHLSSDVLSDSFRPFPLCLPLPPPPSLSHTHSPGMKGRVAAAVTAGATATPTVIPPTVTEWTAIVVMPMTTGAETTTAGQGGNTTVTTMSPTTAATIATQSGYLNDTPSGILTGTRSGTRKTTMMICTRATTTVSMQTTVEEVWKGGDAVGALVENTTAARKGAGEKGHSL